MTDTPPTPSPDEAEAATPDPGPDTATGDTSTDALAEAATGDPSTDTPTGDPSTDTPTADTTTADTAAAGPDGGGDGDGGAEGDTGGPDDDPAATVPDADLQAAADAVEVDLELLLAEREQYLDAYRRAQADFENYRKQAQKRLDDAVLRSLGGLVERLLPVLDSCDAALAHGASEVEPVVSALYGALAKEGLERIDPKGSAFDPAEAEAVVHEPGEGGEQVVAEVLRPGYRWRGRVIRPAMVKVTD
jgi:molecular chaperone GrpE